MNNATRGRLLEAKTVAWLESLGYRAGIVGKRGRHGVDLFGCCDLVSVHPEHGVELHQVTTPAVAAGKSARPTWAGRCVSGSGAKAPTGGGSRPRKSSCRWRSGSEALEIYA
jgi:hypothetical protein